LDEELPERPYQASLDLQRDRLRDPQLTPSARMLAEMAERGESFFEFAQRMSKQHERYFQQLGDDHADQGLLQQEVADSWRRQREIEAADRLSFDEFLAQYFAQTL
jgi:glutamate--cysteine ligase